MQLAFDPYLFLVMMRWYNPLMRAIILLIVDENFWMCLHVYACHLSWADIWVDFICTYMYM